MTNIYLFSIMNGPLDDIFAMVLTLLDIPQNWRGSLFFAMRVHIIFLGKNICP